MKAKKLRAPVSRLDDRELQATPAAMERAVRQARRVARQHGTGVLVVENGKMVEIEPDPTLFEGNRRKDASAGASDQQARTRRQSAVGSRQSAVFR